MLDRTCLVLATGLLLTSCGLGIGGSSQCTIGGAEYSRRAGIYRLDGVEMPYSRWVPVDLGSPTVEAYHLLAFEHVDLRGAADTAPALEVELRTQYEGDGTARLDSTGRLKASSERGGAVAVANIRGSLANGPALVIEAGLIGIALNTYTSSAEVALSASNGDLNARAITAPGLQLEAAMGSVTVEDSQVERFVCGAGMGSQVLTALEADQIELELGMGDASLVQVRAANLSINTGMGDVSLSDCVVEGQLSVDSGMGDLAISGGSVGELVQDLGMGDFEKANGARIGDG